MLCLFIAIVNIITTFLILNIALTIGKYKSDFLLGKIACERFENKNVQVFVQVCTIIRIKAITQKCLFKIKITEGLSEQQDLLKYSIIPTFQTKVGKQKTILLILSLDIV